MKTAFILRGIPGVGKSYLGDLIAPGHVFASDDFPGIYDAEGKYVFALMSASHAWNKQRVEEVMLAGVTPLVIANNSIALRDYQEYLDLCTKYHYAASIWHGEGTILPDGTLTSNVHNVPVGVLLRRQVQYQPYVHPVKIDWQRFLSPEAPYGLTLWDKDGTLIFNPNGGIPKASEQAPIPGMPEKIEALYDAGNRIVVVSNQAGVTTLDKETGKPHKTTESLLVEVRELFDFYPEIDLFLGCPDLEGEKLLMLKPGWKDFRKCSKSPEWPPFRKPGTGMIKVALEEYVFNSVAMVGNAKADELAATAAGIPYQHVHDFLYR